MEHKAQESLDYIESLEASTLGDLMVGETADKEVSILQNLIDCQLTVEEHAMISFALGYGMNHFGFGLAQTNRTLNKLNEQRRMWEKEEI